MEKVACIFGSTGLIGRYLLDQLLADERYRKIIVFNRVIQSIEHQKIEQIVAKYEQILHFKEQLKANEYYCCLGTTMKKAKTKEAFEYVDYHLPLEVGKLARINDVKSLMVVSSIGSSATSGNFYLKTKGKMEEGISRLGIENLFIYRPSMLLGKRNESRLMESIAKPISIALGIFLWGPLKKYRAIHGKTVAKAMIFSANQMTGTHIIESDQIKKLVTQS